MSAILHTELIQSDWIVWINFGLNLDIQSGLQNDRKCLPQIADQTDPLSSFQKFMQIRSKVSS